MNVRMQMLREIEIIENKTHEKITKINIHSYKINNCIGIRLG